MAKRAIGIVTIQNRFNYGNRLQNYATASVYASYGHKPVSLVLNRKPPLIQEAKYSLNLLLGRIEPPREESMSPERLAAFDRFNNSLEFKTLNGLSTKDINDIDLFSVGSDQIWGMHRSAYGEDWRFLQFVEPERRIALAPSFGIDSPLTNAQLGRLARYINGYAYISVREESGANFIKQASGRDAAVICDPTMVLAAPEWRSIADDRVTPEGEFVFAYLLGADSPEAKSALNIATRHGELPVVLLSDREKQGERPAGPAEFISLVDKATWVVTDSFHGSVFASIFQKPLTIIHRGGGEAMYSRMFGRIETLSKKLGIEYKVYGSPSFDYSRAGDYAGVPEAIARERGKFLEYLEACLDV